MISAFDYLRQFKEVDPETERLVKKKTYGIPESQLLDIFERGISGDFGKVYKCDPQTILGWVADWRKGQDRKENYLSTGLLDPSKKHFDLKNEDWMREANKCFTAFLSGTSEQAFHPGVYDRMMLDGKIQLNACMKYLGKGYQDSEVISAKQKVLRDVFLTYKSNGWSKVYNV